MSQRDVFLIKPFPKRIRLPDDDNSTLFSPRRTLVAGGRGTLGEGEIFGRVVLVTKDIEHAVMTEDLLRIRPVAAYQGLVYAFLSTLLGRRLLRSTAVGTKIHAMRPDLVERLPLPEVSPEQLKRIDDHVDKAMSARERASSAEAEAIRIMEQEVIPAWLA